MSRRTEQIGSCGSFRVKDRTDDVGGKLVDIKIGKGCRSVGHGSGGDISFEIAADGTLDSRRRGEFGDGSGVEQATVFPGVDADDVCGFESDAAEGVFHCEDGFVGHDGEADGATDASEAFQIKSVNGLFDEGDAEFFELRCGTDGLIFRPAPVGVHGDANVRSDGFADPADAFEIVR